MEAGHCKRCGGLVYSGGDLCSRCSATTKVAPESAAEETRYCTGCGQMIVDVGAGFCDNCGQATGGTSAVSAPVPAASTSSAPKLKASWRQKKPPVWTVVMAALCTCGAIGGAVWAISEHNEAANQAHEAAEAASAELVRATGSDTASASTTSSGETQSDQGSSIADLNAETEVALESVVKNGIHSLHIALASYSVDHNDDYPRPSSGDELIEVLRPYLDTWPTNPYTGEPMAVGSGPGDFSYAASENGSSFVLKGFGRNKEVLITAP